MSSTQNLICILALLILHYITNIESLTTTILWNNLQVLRICILCGQTVVHLGSFNGSASLQVKKLSSMRALMEFIL